MVSVIKTMILFCSLLLWFPWLPTTTGQECAAGEWKCRNNTCVNMHARCDGDIDCGDGSDEENCEKWRCPDGRWKCHNHRCILMTLRCDGKNDCGDGSEETNCEYWMCPAHKWKCSNNRCVSASSRCDGKDNCGDGSDEINCALARCPRYVMEGEDATCLCQGGKFPTLITKTWLHNPAQEPLNLTSVQRKDNGTQYTCITAGGVTTDVFTLRVAYGPFEGHVTVEPSRFIANGSQTFNMTCNVTDVYPTPYYTWSGVTCENELPENTCTFTPDPAADDLKNVTCAATSVTLKRTASKTVQLGVFLDPPREKPVINSKNEESGILRRGDIVTCTVPGGKPTVDSVQFYCVNPDLPDEDDEINLTSVSSSVTVTGFPSNMMTKMECVCNAIWEIEPKCYQLTSTAVFNVELAEETVPSGSLKMALGVTVAILSLSAIVISSVVILKRRGHLQSLSFKTTRQAEIRISGLYDGIEEYPMHRQYRSPTQVNLPVGPPPPRPLPLPPVSLDVTTNTRRHVSQATDHGVFATSISAVSLDKTLTDELDTYNTLLHKRERMSEQDPTYSHTRTTANQDSDQDGVYNHLLRGRESTSDQDPTYSHTNSKHHEP